MGDEVVGEGGEPVEVARGSASAGAVEVGGGDLGALEEGDRAALVGGGVGEGLPVGEQVGERGGRAGGGVDHRLEAAAVIGEDVLADVAQRGRVVRHQRMRGVLAEDGGDLGRARARVSSAADQGPLVAEALGQAGGDREVAAVAGALADRRPPAGAEVDRVEAEDEGGAGLAVALDQLGRRVGRGRRDRAAASRPRRPRSHPPRSAPSALGPRPRRRRNAPCSGTESSPHPPIGSRFSALALRSGCRAARRAATPGATSGAGLTAAALAARLRLGLGGGGAACGSDAPAACGSGSSPTPVRA